jgi:hypothetical protein
MRFLDSGPLSVLGNVEERFVLRSVHGTLCYNS